MLGLGCSTHFGFGRPGLPGIWSGACGGSSRASVQRGGQCQGYWNDGVRNIINTDLPSVKPRPAVAQSAKIGGIWAGFSPAMHRSFSAVPPANDSAGWRVIATYRADTAPLWDIPIPGQPALNGLSMSPAGDVLVSLLNGLLVCVGGH